MSAINGQTEKKGTCKKQEKLLDFKPRIVKFASSETQATDNYERLLYFKTHEVKFSSADTQTIDDNEDDHDLKMAKET